MLTIKRAAEILNVSPGLIYALCAHGRIQHERYGLGRGTIRIREEAIVEFQARSHAIPDKSSPGKTGAFTHLNATRLIKAWKSRGVL
jgi:excisionase family DNA binding protein